MQLQELTSMTKQTLLPALPGLALCALIAIAAFALERVEHAVFGRAWLEALVLAILLGAALRTVAKLDARFEAGVQFCATLALEIAVVLLGASVSASAVLAQGIGLVAGIAALVALSLLLSLAIGRAFGLSPKLALLIACGNSICGNSAIAAVAPVIKAEGTEVAAAIAFTAALGVVVVLTLPLSMPLLGFTPGQFGVFAGLTVYAVPQVLAATSAVSPISMQLGTLVKLVRVLMLGPLILILSVLYRGAQRPSLGQLVPWFIVGFLIAVTLRSLGAIPAAALGPIHMLATALSVLSMAALGLSVDVHAVLRAGRRVACVVTLSLLGLAGLSVALIRLLEVA
jgi:uncharacterized integral membrane protein (TIGR00698 family)